MSQPQSSKDGASQRTNFLLSGPLSATVGFRLSGNIAKTDSDKRNINRGYQSTRGVAANGTDYRGTYPAGREGVRNRDLAAKLVFQPVAEHQFDLDASFSRQGNIYTGDTQNTNNYTTNASGKLVCYFRTSQSIYWTRNQCYVSENYAFTHHGEYDFGRSLSYVQYEKDSQSSLGRRVSRWY